MLDEATLILNPNGSIYHLSLFPEEIADTIIFVGDPNRVPMVSKNFDIIECKRQNREFVTHTGYLNKKRLTVISTGIGTDNIDICINELDALTNIDFASRTIKPKLTSLNIIRIGTTGSIQADIPVDSFLMSQYALGFDTLLSYYHHNYQPNELRLLNAISQHLNSSFLEAKINPYLVPASAALVDLFSQVCIKGLSASCVGFYGPQGRQLRAQIAFPNLIQTLQSFKDPEGRITNLEMETSGIYSLSQVLNHQYCSLNAVIANRATGEISQHMENLIKKLITISLDKIVAIK